MTGHAKLFTVALTMTWLAAVGQARPAAGLLLRADVVPAPEILKLPSNQPPVTGPPTPDAAAPFIVAAVMLSGLLAAILMIASQGDEGEFLCDGACLGCVCSDSCRAVRSSS